MIKLIQDHIYNMSDDDAETECYKIIGMKSWLDTSPEKLLGFIIKNLIDWNCNLYIDDKASITISFLAFPMETKIHSPSINKAFLQTAFVLMKWKPDIKEETGDMTAR